MAPLLFQLKILSALCGNHLSPLASLSLGEFSPTSGRPHLFPSLLPSDLISFFLGRTQFNWHQNEPRLSSKRSLGQGHGLSSIFIFISDFEKADNKPLGPKAQNSEHKTRVLSCDISEKRHRTPYTGFYHIWTAKSIDILHKCDPTFTVLMPIVQI